jgi:hypothetical protein
MCFSATACLATGAILVPTGIYTLVKAYRGNRSYLVLAAFPLIFGLQQIIEGGVWLGLEHKVEINIEIAAIVYLFIAYNVWPFLVPLAVFLVEKNTSQKLLFKVFSLIGLLFGTSLFVPLLIYPEWLSVTIAEDSILYQSLLIYDGIVSKTIVSIVYAIIVAIPLLFTTVKSLRFFGILVFMSVTISATFFAYAFISIWCFFAAILAAYIVYVVHIESQNKNFSN